MYPLILITHHTSIIQPTTTILNGIIMYSFGQFRFNNQPLSFIMFYTVMFQSIVLTTSSTLRFTTICDSVLLVMPNFLAAVLTPIRPVSISWMIANFFGAVYFLLITKMIRAAPVMKHWLFSSRYLNKSKLPYPEQTCFALDSPKYTDSANLAASLKALHWR